jgi:bacillithiol system protein YtxJ
LFAYFCTMNSWKSVTEKEQFYSLLENSAEKPQIIFKDSRTCGISAHAKHRLEMGFGLIAEKVDFHYLDLLTYRPISNLVAQELKVTHQSPQIILLKNKQVVYTSSHHAIDPAVIAKHLS